MPNTFLTPSVIAREALLLLESTLVATMLFDRRYQTEFTGNEKVGDTITIRRRDDAPVTEYNGSSVTPVDLIETGTTLVLEKHFDVTIKLSSIDLTLELQDFSEQILAPNVLNIAEAVDAYALTKIKDLPNVFGPASGGIGSAALPASIADMASVRRGMNDNKIPMANRMQVASTEYEQALLSVPSFVEADKAGSTEALRNASIGRLSGLDTFMDQNVDDSTHTVGAGVSAGTLSADAAKGATTIDVTGMGNAGTFTVDDILNIAGYGGVVVDAPLTLNGSGAGTVTIREPLRDAIASSTAVTPYASDATWESHGAAFHPRAFAFASVPLALPRGAEAAAIQDRGLSIRAVWDYDRNLKSDVISLDVLVGAKMVDGRLGGQILKDGA